MNCRDFEPLLALYAGGDLDETAPVEAHLAQCSVCRELLEDLQASQTVLRDWSPEPVDAAFLASVRSGVLAGIENRRARVWPWVAGFAAAAAAVIVFVAAPRDSVPPPPRPAPPLVAEAPVINATAPAPKPRKRVVKHDAEPLVVKMLTDDPDIVVIWLVDQTGD